MGLTALDKSDINREMTPKQFVTTDTDIIGQGWWSLTSVSFELMSSNFDTTQFKRTTERHSEAEPTEPLT